MKYPTYSKIFLSFPLLVFVALIFVLSDPVLVNAAKPVVKVTPMQKAFSRAIQKNDLERAKALITEGADVNMSIQNFTPLMLARTPAMIKLLANAGADVNAKSELFKQTVLMFVVSQGKVDAVKALIEAGADVNAKDEASGISVLATAIMVNRPKIKIIKTLIDAGADPNDGQVLGMSLMNFAVMKGKIDILQALIAGGADINARSKQGATPLMVAVSSRKTEVAKFLIDAGADVNGSDSTGASKKNRKSSGTTMDMAMLTGDSEMMAMLKKEEVKESDKPPEPDTEKPNPPRIYSLPCKLTGSPPPQGKHFSCSAVGDIAESGVEVSTLSQAFFAGKHAVPRKNGCQFDLGQPGFYRIRTTTISTPWDLVCRAGLGTTSGGKNWIAFIETKKPVIKITEKRIVINDSKKKPPKDDEEPPSIKIVKPLKDEQFVFNDANPSVLEIDAEAEIGGDCDDVASWKMEDIGKSDKKFDPEGASNIITIKFSELPKNNTHFGRKKITASACGKSDTVMVDVFYPPKEKNHTGKGSGEIPNWFYYWRQTRASSGFRPHYTPVKIATNGSKAVGQYDYTADKVFITDRIMQKGCAARVAALGGKESTGIDCFAETVRHETQHQKERWEWWGKIDPTVLPGSASRAYDADGDLVPNKIEKKLEKIKNCSEWDPTSCDGRPKDTLFDIEMNAYWIGWEWPVGSADKYDWTWCGKQWKDLSECPGKQSW